MAYRRPVVKSPPRNFKVNYIEEPPLETAQVNFITNLVPKIARKNPSGEDIQLELSQELCKYLQKSVAVLVTEKKDNIPQVEQTHMFPVTFRFSMNEYLYKVWIHEDNIVFDENPFKLRR